MKVRTQRSSRLAVWFDGDVREEGTGVRLLATVFYVREKPYELAEDFVANFDLANGKVYVVSDGADGAMYEYDETDLASPTPIRPDIGAILVAWGAKGELHVLRSVAG